MIGVGSARIDPQIVNRIRERFNVSDVAARLGYAFRPSGHEFIGHCPFHKERSPSWTLNDAKGFAHCFGCGSHEDTIGLVMGALGLGFVEALAWLDSSELPAVDPAQRRAQEVATREAKREQIQAARSFFKDAEDVRRGDPVDVYLRARGLSLPPPPTIRFGMVPAWQDRESKEWGPARPCMLCAAQDPAGTIMGVQRVFFLNDDPALGKADKPKRSLGSIRGNPGRLGPPAAHVNLAEGPEDGLSAREMMLDRPCWIAFGTSQMPFARFPSVVAEVTLLGQNNAPSRTALAKSAEELKAGGYGVREAYPPARFDDWNDLIQGRELAA